MMNTEQVEAALVEAMNAWRMRFNGRVGLVMIAFTQGDEGRLSTNARREDVEVVLRESLRSLQSGDATILDFGGVV